MSQTLDAFSALREMLSPVPLTRTVVANEAPRVRRACCAKCPFGDALPASAGLTRDCDLTPSEAAAAELLRARLAGRLAAGENVVWGCHETVDHGKPQVCPGFLEWTRPRSDLDA